MGDADRLTALLSALLGERRLEADVVSGELAGPPGRRRSVAVELASRDVAEFGPDLVRCWSRCAEERPLIERALRGDPAARLERRRPERSVAPHPGGPAVQAAFAPERLSRYVGAIAAVPPDGERDQEALLRAMPGLLQLAARESPSPSRRARLRQIEEAELARRFPPQVSVVPSYACNRRCDYCFTPRVDATEASTSRHALEAAVDAIGARRPGVRVGIFGGEPTAWQELPEFLAALHARGRRAYFSTNGVVPMGRLRAILRSRAVECVTLHADRPQRYRAGEKERVLDTARVLRGWEGAVVVRHVLVDPEARDFGFLDEILDLLPAAAASFAVALPSVDGSNVHAPLDRLAAFAPKILALVRHLRARALPPPSIVLAKPFPLCAFTPIELSALLAAAELHNRCEIDRSGFTDQLHVQPDLTVSPCMALTAVRAPAPAPAAELGVAFSQRLAPLLEAPMLTPCRRCSLAEAGACQPACYAYLPAPKRTQEGRHG